MTEPYKPHLTDPDLELSPVTDLDLVPDDEDRTVLLYDGTWLPYPRVAALVRQKLTPVQEKTSRTSIFPALDIDIASLSPDDLVVINDTLYSGFDLKELLYGDDAIALLLGEGAIRPHVCSEPASAPAPKPEPKPISFWETGWACALWVVTGVIAAFVHLIVYGTLNEMFIDVSTRTSLITAFPLGSLVASGGLTMLCAKLRDQKTQGEAFFIWAATLWSCLWASFGIIAALVLCIKLAA